MCYNCFGFPIDEGDVCKFISIGGMWVIIQYIYFKYLPGWIWNFLVVDIMYVLDSLKISLSINIDIVFISKIDKKIIYI